MNVNVTRIQVSITNEYVLNSQEYNINKCYFTFSQEYTNELVKKAIFEQGTNLVEEPIINNECMIPSEVLNRGTFTLRVYAYEIQDEELVLRYSPTPTLVYVRSGSYIEGAESPEVITPSQFEQYMQALNDGLVEVANVDIDAEQLTNGTKITITDRTGTEKIVYVYDGTDGVNGIDATINGVNTLNIVAGTNIGLSQDEDTLTINNTYDDTQIKTDITNLQEQIDGITASSDVKDIVGTYQDLLNYDTQHLGNNDIIKVLQDSTHNNAMTYYRWDKNNSQWIYVGQEGPYYTKSESDDKFVEFTDYATSSKGGTIKVDQNYGLRVNSSGTLIGYGVNYNDYQSANNQLVVDKGTLENVITGKNLETANNKVASINSSSTDTQYPSAKCVYDSQETQNEQIEENTNNLGSLQHQVDYNEKYANALIKETKSGTDLSINDTAECPMPMSLAPSELSQEADPTPSSSQDIHTITGNNTITISNNDNTKSQTLPITLGDLEYCKIGTYADEFYKATASDTGLTAGKWYLKKNIGKIVLDGTQTIGAVNTSSTNTTRVVYYSLANNFGAGAICNRLLIRNIWNSDNEGIYYDIGNLYFRINKATIGTTNNEINSYLLSNNIILYAVLATPTYTLLNDTLQTQLENIYEWALSYQDQTNISQVNNDLPFVISASAVMQTNKYVDDSIAGAITDALGGSY